MRILITGGSGLLAVNWAIAARAQNEVFLGLHSRYVQLESVFSEVIDLESVDSLARIFDRLELDAVIHTAGITNVEECEKRKELAVYVNTCLAENVAKACKLARTKLVHISTDHLFRGDSPNLREDAPLEPQNVYAMTKAEAERRVQKHCPDVLIVRTNFFGWGPRYRKSFTDVILQSLRSGQKISLFRDVFFTPILIGVLADAVHLLIERGSTGVFNIVGNKRISKYKFGVMVADYFGENMRLIESSSIKEACHLVNRPLDMSLSNEKVCAELGKQLGSLEKSIRMLKETEQSIAIREILAL